MFSELEVHGTSNTTRARIFGTRYDLSMFACDTIGYDTRCYFNVRSKADMNRLNLPHGDDN